MADLTLEGLERIASDARKLTPEKTGSLNPSMKLPVMTVLALVAEVKELRRIQEHQVREYAKEVVTNQQLVARVLELKKETDELWQVLYITANARDKTTAGKVRFNKA